MNIASNYFSRIYLKRKDIIRTSIDISFFAASYVLAFMLRFDGFIPGQYLWPIMVTLPAVVLLRLAAFSYFGLFKGVWRYTGVGDLQALFKAISVSSFGVVAAVYLSHAFHGFPRSVFIIDAGLLILLSGGVRFVRKSLAFSHAVRAGSNGRRRVLIVGAGDAGESVLREMRKGVGGLYEAVAFADDDPSKRGKVIHNIEVAGLCRDIPSIAAAKEIDEIIIAIPSAKSAQIAEIVKYCREAKKPYKTIPAFGENGLNGALLNQLREIQLEDIICRQTVALDLSDIRAEIEGQTVMVTGAGGSIGKQLCRQIAAFGPKELVLFERGENSLFYLDRELKDDFPQGVFAAILGDITNKHHVWRCLMHYRPKFVFHAAAHKHVPMSELNPAECIRNNLIGTRDLVDACVEAGVESFVLLSTDKAANPINIMGMSKRLGEIYVQAAAQNFSKRYMSVRFGNVLESTGSVVRLFKEQIAKSKPITITHPDATRYFMSKQEAVQLVLKAAALGKGGEIFILDMGEPHRIVDVAKELISLVGGYGSYSSDTLLYTELRPGEKLTETLVNEGEELHPSACEKIKVVAPVTIDFRKIRADLESIEKYIANLGSSGRSESESKLRRKVRELQVLNCGSSNRRVAERRAAAG